MAIYVAFFSFYILKYALISDYFWNLDCVEQGIKSYRREESKKVNDIKYRKEKHDPVNGMCQHRRSREQTNKQTNKKTHTPCSPALAHKKGILFHRTTPQGSHQNMKIFTAAVFLPWDCKFSLQIFKLLRICEQWHMCKGNGIIKADVEE